MAASCRFAFAVHVLAVLALKRDADVTSDVLAASVNTNPVVIRRLLCALREAGLVQTHRGAGGGARLRLDPHAITLDAIYHAVEHGSPFSPHPHQPDQRCPVGRNIELVLGEIFSSAHSALEHALARHTLANVLENVTESNPGNASTGQTLSTLSSGIR